MQNNESNEPALSTERMAGLDNSRAPRAEVEDRIVGALHGSGVLHNYRSAFALQRSANSAQRTVWMAGLSAVAATAMFLAGMKAGERGSNARAVAALVSSAATANALATTCPAMSVAALPSPSQLIWY